ncbi:hypothetical protein UY3_15436 [Chelonia mydas]|uniref:Uncharacterized protein n=1 Tax=Chelonia mydas TaxID=8469 RepID=M7AQA6_CHEMY|nr:hypothetical protein UY3_15436 [Chelonia mydas]
MLSTAMRFSVTQVIAQGCSTENIKLEHFEILLFHASADDKDRISLSYGLLRERTLVGQLIPQFRGEKGALNPPQEGDPSK